MIQITPGHFNRMICGVVVDEIDFDALLEQMLQAAGDEPFLIIGCQQGDDAHAESHFSQPLRIASAICSAGDLSQRTFISTIPWNGSSLSNTVNGLTPKTRSMTVSTAGPSWSLRPTVNEYCPDFRTTGHQKVALTVSSARSDSENFIPSRAEVTPQT